MTDQEWRSQMEELVSEIRSKIPPDIPPEQLKADAEAACDEARREHGARRRAEAEAARREP